VNTLDVLIKCRVTRQLVLLLELLNKVWGLKGCCGTAMSDCKLQGG